jgi:hypothetical protein
MLISPSEKMPFFEKVAYLAVSSGLPELAVENTFDLVQHDTMR